MQQFLKYLRPGIPIAAFMFLCALIFQNCAGYQSNDQLLFQDQNSSLDKSNLKLCIGELCPKDLDEVTMVINNQAPIGITSNEPAIDLGGYCNAAGYTETQFFYSIKNTAGQVVLGDTVATEKCDDLGRWRLRVGLPPGYDYTREHTVTVSMRIKNEAGQWRENPRGTHRKDIRVTSI
jgi:hypothetical protein